MTQRRFNIEAIPARVEFMRVLDRSQDQSVYIQLISPINPESETVPIIISIIEECDFKHLERHSKVESQSKDLSENEIPQELLRIIKQELQK